MFLVFSFIGWILDTTYCSLFIYHRFKPSGYFKNIPLCPVYGLGGLLIYGLFTVLEKVPALLVIPITSIAVIAFEYFAGKFCLDVFKERLWDYSKKKIHLDGFITLENSIYWVIIVLALYYFSNPHLDEIHQFFARLSEKIGGWDLFIACAFILFTYELTIYTRDKRLGVRTRSEIFKRIEELNNRDLVGNLRQMRESLKRKIMRK